MKKIARSVIAAFFVFLLMPTRIYAGTYDPREVLFSVRSIKCTFGLGASSDWGETSVKVERRTWNTTMHFDSIDMKVGRARLIGNLGSTDVALLVTFAGISFIEQTVFGNLVFTTVFASHPMDSKKFIAVTSRHMLMMERPIPSQYHGTCEIWE